MVRESCFVVLALLLGGVNAQDDSGVSVQSQKIGQLESKIDTLSASFESSKATIDKLKKIKISAYLQTQFRYADTVASAGYSIGEFSGGKFVSGVQSNFQIRRSRFKIGYDAGLSKVAIQLDATPKGVSTKEAYLEMKEPWINSTSLRAGLFDRPFGFEVSYSSSSIESPERSRVMQTMFKDEKDLGAMITFKATDKMPSPVSLFDIKAGLFTGNGIADESDDTKDFIGRVGVSVPFSDKKYKLTAGASYYSGKVTLANDTVYTLTSGTWSPSGSNLSSVHDRTYSGIDASFQGDLPVTGNFTVRGEYMMGTQPAGSSSSLSPTSSSSFEKPLYVRDFSGFYVMYIQDLGSKFQGVIKYDSYDPNTDLEEKEITSAGDITFSTLGGGLNYALDANVRFTAWYDYVINEETNNSKYTKDVTDNVFTFRAQYTF